jgi:hypothetical protein
MLFSGKNLKVQKIISTLHIIQVKQLMTKHSALVTEVLSK